MNTPHDPTGPAVDPGSTHGGLDSPRHGFPGSPHSEQSSPQPRYLSLGDALAGGERHFLEHRQPAAGDLESARYGTTASGPSLWSLATPLTQNAPDAMTVPDVAHLHAAPTAVQVRMQPPATASSPQQRQNVATTKTQEEK